jgi:dual specificity MAP kinase phosphatase
MAIKGLTLPEAYLELQVAKRRSFFVYHNDLGLLRRMEARLREERERSGLPSPGAVTASNTGGGGGNTNSPPRNWGSNGGSGHRRPTAKSVSFATPPNLPGFRKSTNIVTPPGNYALQQQALEEDVCMTVEPQPVDMTASLGSLPSDTTSGGESISTGVVKSRPRANTSPWLPSLFSGDHQTWFNDPRFDGSFPSRVLPFLYLGNL